MTSERMTDADIDRILLAANTDGSGCKCHAKSSGECACGVVWFSDVKHKAVQAITQLRERAENAEKWKHPSISLGTKDTNGFPAQYECRIVDIGHSDVGFVVECPDAEDDTDTLQSQLTLAEQQRDAAVEGLERISKQRLAEEVDPEERDDADYETGYECIVRDARGTLARIRDLTNQPERNDT